MESNIKTTIKSWYYLDEQIKKNHSEIIKMRKKRDKLEKRIIEYMNANKLENNKININNEHVKYSISNKSITVSKKYIITKINEYYKNDKCLNNPNDLISFIFDNREKIKKINLKRCK